MLQSTPAYTVPRPPFLVLLSIVAPRPPLYLHWHFSFCRLLVASPLLSFLPVTSTRTSGHPFAPCAFYPRDISICRQQASSANPSFSEPPTVGTMRNAFLWLKFSDAGSIPVCHGEPSVPYAHVYVCVGVDGGGFPQDQGVEIFDERLSECQVTRRSCRWGISG